MLHDRFHQHPNSWRFFVTTNSPGALTLPGGRQPLRASLNKDERVPLTANLDKGGDVLEEIEIGGGWEPQTDKSDQPFDLDLFLFGLDDEGYPTDLDDLIYFNHPNALAAIKAAKAAGTYNPQKRPPFWNANQSIWHSGDSLDGVGDGIDERIRIIFSKLPSRIKKLEWGIGIDKAQIRNQTFGMVDGCFFEIAGGPIVPRFDLTRSPEAANATFMLMGSAEQTPGGPWVAQRHGEPVEGGTAGYFTKKYVDLT
jgi:tellurium resistance protein TerD